MSDTLVTPEKLPRRWQRLALRLLTAIGWRAHFKPFPGPHGVIIVYPHTSNWDFPIAILFKWAVGVPIRWLGKEALFNGVGGFFMGRIMRRLGGQPIERNASSGAIERLGQTIQNADWYWLAIAPEGTRDYRPHWRTGFYHIAMAAKVPLAMAFIDYKRRELGVVDFLDLSGDIERDMEQIRAFFAGREGLHPELAAPIKVAPPNS
jgi:1-acyl-sn-glycerol-3-phosphate acyltransferase